MENVDWKILFSDRLKEKGLTLRKLSEISGIPLNHLESLAHEDFHNLPAAPYFRGYLQKLGHILEFDASFWWEYFRKTGLVKSSGMKDELPKNRFATKPIARFIWFGVLLVLIVGYFGIRFTKIFGRPTITIIYPSEAMITVTEPTVRIYGEVQNADQLLVGTDPVLISPDHFWEKNIVLQPGPNPLEITAKKFLGREVKVIRQIFYEPPADAESPAF